MAPRAIQGDCRHGGKPIGTKVFGFSTGSKYGSAGPCWIAIHPIRSAIAHYRGSDSLLARLIAISGQWRLRVSQNARAHEGSLSRSNFVDRAPAPSIP